jgi:hypothetical protein
MFVCFAPGPPQTAWDTTGIYYHIDHTGVKTHRVVKAPMHKKYPWISLKNIRGMGAVGDEGIEISWWFRPAFPQKLAPETPRALRALPPRGQFLRRAEPISLEARAKWALFAPVVGDLIGSFSAFFNMCKILPERKDQLTGRGQGCILIANKR